MIGASSSLKKQAIERLAFFTVELHRGQVSLRSQVLSFDLNFEVDV